LIPILFETSIIKPAPPTPDCKISLLLLLKTISLITALVECSPPSPERPNNELTPLHPILFEVLPKIILPLVIIFPDTSNFSDGFVLPIPTLPEL